MSLIASAFFWVISVTPFGIYGPVRGGHWVIPMGHGPVPFGSYLGFCEAARKGFFQNRYLALLNTWGEIMDRLPSNPKPMSVIGSSDGHMLNLVSQQRRTPVTDQQIAFDFAGEHLREPGRKVMLFNSYSRLSYLNAPGAEALVRAWLSQGLVESLTGEPDMPLAVEVGPEVKNGSRALGQRILFAEEQARDAGLAPALYFTRDYDTFCWVPAASRPAHVLYRDEEFYATTDCGPTARLWGNWWPSVYYQRYADRAKSALTH